MQISGQSTENSSHALRLTDNNWQFMVCNVIIFSSIVFICLKIFYVFVTFLLLHIIFCNITNFMDACTVNIPCEWFSNLWFLIIWNKNLLYSTPKKFRVQQSVGEIMATVFLFRRCSAFGIHAITRQSLLETPVLQQWWLYERISNRNAGESCRLLHDNAPAHKSRASWAG